MEYSFEAHFVHISKDGKIAVIGVMFKEGKENKVVEMSKKQVKAFFDLYGHLNDRPIQPTNNREITYYKN